MTRYDVAVLACDNCVKVAFLHNYRKAAPLAHDGEASYSEAETSNVFKSVREWHRPRPDHSFWDRWFRDVVLLLPVWPLMHVFFSGPWYEGIGSTVRSSFIYALGEYGYF